MPVNGSQAFVGIKGARSAGEGFVVEYLFEDLFQKGTLFGHEFPVPAGGQAIQSPLQVSRIPEIAVEMESSQHVLVHDLSVSVGHQLSDQFRIRGGGSRNQVFLQEPGQLLVGIEEIAVLVFPEEGAFLHGIEYFQGFRRAQIARAQDGHLPFQHFAEMGHRDPRSGGGHQVVGMVELVGSLVAADGVFDESEAQIGKFLQDGQGDGGFSAPETLMVNFLAVVGSGPSQEVKQFFSLCVAEIPR